MSSGDVCASVITRVVYSECLFVRVCVCVCVCVNGGTFMVWLTGVYVLHLVCMEANGGDCVRLFFHHQPPTTTVYSTLRRDHL